MAENKPIYKNLIYMGKTLVNEGKRDDGTEWKLWQVITKEFKDSDYEMKIKIFEPLKKGLSLKDLEEGTIYQFGYKKEPYEHKEYGTVNANKGFYITTKMEDKTKSTPSKPSSTSENSDEEEEILAEADKGSNYSDMIREYSEAYIEKVAPDKRRLNNYLGGFFLKANSGNGKGIAKAVVNELLKEYRSKVDIPVEEVV